MVLEASREVERMIRRAAVEDVAAMHAIEEASFPPRVRWTKQEMLNEVQMHHVACSYYYGGDEEQVVGCMEYAVRDGLGFIDSVAAKPAMRGLHHGRDLVLFALADMYRRGAECVELNCDISLERWYERVGFARCGIMTVGIGAKQEKRVRMRHVPGGYFSTNPKFVEEITAAAGMAKEAIYR